MTTQESSLARSIGSFLGNLLTLAAIVVVVGVGVYYYPKIRAGFQQTAPEPTQPAAAPNPTPWVIIQSVPQNAAPQPVNVPVQAPPPPAADQSIAPAAPPLVAPAPIVIVQHDGYQQPVITGSGACAVAKGARRCGK